MSVDAKVMTVVAAIKQSIETSAGPGVSVNSHPNPFFINVSGAIDLKNAAVVILARLEEYEVAFKKRIEAAIAAADAEALKVAAKVVDEVKGAV